MPRVSHDNAGLVEQVDTAGLNPAASVCDGSSPSAGTILKDHLRAAIQNAAARVGPGEVVPVTAEIVALLGDRDPEPGHPSNPAVERKPATDAERDLELIGLAKAKAWREGFDAGVMAVKKIDALIPPTGPTNEGHGR